MELISSSENEESDEYMADKGQTESFDGKPMRINVQDKPAAYHFERREGNSYHLLILNLYSKHYINSC